VRPFAPVHYRDCIDDLADAVLVHWRMATLKPVLGAETSGLLERIEEGNSGKYSLAVRTLTRLGGHALDDKAGLADTLAGPIDNFGPEETTAGGTWVEDHTQEPGSLEVSEGQHIPDFGELEELEVGVKIQVGVEDIG
jgi:hypothetical protein